MLNIGSKNGLKFVKLIVVLIIFSINEIKTDIKCGIPGNSVKSLVKPPLSNEKVTDNGVKVKYSCDYNDAPFLIGYNERVCEEKGDWSQSIPKCATIYTGNHVINSTANSNAINITLTNAARISGLVVRVSSFDPIEVMNIKNIPSPECFKANTTTRDKIPFHSNRRKYTTLFHCPTKDVDIWTHPEVSWILITFSEKIRNCELDSCPAVLEFIELYEAINDECLKPDVPAFGKLIPIKRSGAIVRYKYLCEDYFDMQERRTTEISCVQYEEWSPRRLPKCFPNVTCDVERIDELKVSYNWLWNEMEAVVGTVATFECLNNFTKINGSTKRECRPNGEWSEELPQCSLITTTTVESTITRTSPPLKYMTTTPTPYVNQQSYHPIYPTPPPPPPGPFMPHTPYPMPYPTPYPTPYQTPYPAPYPPQEYTPMSAAKERSNNSALNATHLVYIILGILLGILITIGVIYYIHRKRRNESRSGHHNRTQVGDEVYYDHMNNINNFNESRNFSTDQTVDSIPYDSAGYIQIEAVEALRMDSFRKYENYDTNNTRRQHKPLPEIPSKHNILK